MTKKALRKESKEKKNLLQGLEKLEKTKVHDTKGKDKLKKQVNNTKRNLQSLDDKQQV